jgi:hypothetical protein
MRVGHRQVDDAKLTTSLYSSVQGSYSLASIDSLSLSSDMRSSLERPLEIPFQLNNATLKFGSRQVATSGRPPLL